MADGTVRHNRKRRNVSRSNAHQFLPVYCPGLLAASDPNYKEFVNAGLRRLRSNSVTQVASPARDLGDRDVFHIDSLVNIDNHDVEHMADPRIDSDEQIASTVPQVAAVTAHLNSVATSCARPRRRTRRHVQWQLGLMVTC